METMEVIKVTRSVWCATGEKRERVEIVVGPVELDPATKAWVCWCHIPIVLIQPRKVYGEDALQAIVLAFEMCRGSIQHFCDRGGSVWWLEEGDMGGI